MSPQRILGIVLLVVGVIALIMGMNASHSLADQVSNTFTGKFTEATTWYILGGIASAIVGLVLVLFGVRERAPDMQMFECGCGSTLFFDNSRCLTCKRETGWCPHCRAIVAVNGTTGNYSCDRCKSALLKCTNNRELTVCNRFVLMQPGGKAPAYCDCCKFNRTIPDLTVAGNAERWARLEAAKRRMMYDLDMLGLQYGTKAEGFVPGLVFEFKTDKTIENGQWKRIINSEPITTGHADGVITINICEADDVERERMRVNLHEPQRTLIGHFRHEIAHYFWDLLVKQQREEECKAIFGDHTIDYGAAQRTYYAKGAPAGWQNNFVSAYATMHPWEDFAETFGLYLDICGTLDTAEAQGFSDLHIPAKDLKATLERYTPMAIGMNEINRHMGLPDLVPEVFCCDVVKKLQYVHELVAAGNNARPRRQAPPAARVAADTTMKEPAGIAG